MARRKADFTDKIKIRLASRVGWRCCYPMCWRATVGPVLDNDDEVSTLGKAAHIYAAGEKGPRANPHMTHAERAHISNGIWLCDAHADLIDRNPLEFSAKTLLRWKLDAERNAFKVLERLDKFRAPMAETLVAITGRLHFLGVWSAAEEHLYEFTIEQIIGEEEMDLQRLIMEFDREPLWEKYLAIESQGEGRPLDGFSWKINDERKYVVSCRIRSRAPRRSPHSLPMAITLDLDAPDAYKSYGSKGWDATDGRHSWQKSGGKSRFTGEKNIFNTLTLSKD